MNAIQEDVILKIQELREDLIKEVATLDHNYSTLHNKVDVKSFRNVEHLLQELKDIVSKSDFSKSSVVSPEKFTEKCHMLQSTIQKELAPLEKFINFIPTNPPPIPTSLPRTSIFTTSTITTTRPITKAIVIGTVGGESSSSKPNPSEQDKDKGKGVSQELSKEEKKDAQEAEMAKQIQIQSIL
ncbi:unnamed protein product [Lactuca saligna]|uniref:Uncharacterized protein n=1 Tax=Lactuca saligna TaxID=75948 RepID=A0AA35Y586_LACSI|nr:unnamed protein product [Lactuca saligna]